MFYFLLLGFVFTSLCARGAELFHHEFQYPREKDCLLIGSELAKRFSEASGAEIYWAGLTQQTSTNCNLKITYIADKEIELINTMDKSGLGSSYLGTQYSQKDCETDLQREKNLFKESTGLEPWISYCYSESNFLDPLPFVPVIEGIGKPILSFFSSETTFSVTPNSGWQELFAVLQRNATKQSIALASFVARPNISPLDKKVTARFYAKERLFLQTEGIAEHQTAEVCDSQIEEVRAALAGADLPPIGAYCGKYAHSQNRLAIVTLSTNLIGIANLRSVQDPKQFPSLESCRRALASTLDFYRTKLEKKVLTGICANAKSHFQITIIEEKKGKPRLLQ